MAELTTIARPYAQAVFNLANESDSLDKWSANLSFLAQIVANEQVKVIVASPKVSDAQMLTMFESVAADHLDEQGSNFMRLLIENDRVMALPEIDAMFEALKAEAEGTVDAEVISVEPVSEDYKRQIGDVLRKKLGRDVRLNFSLDASLIGGALIKAGDLVIDGTVRGRLTKLAGDLAD